MHRAKSSFDGEPSSVPAARRFVSEAMQAGGAVDYSWAVAQVVSELATNAVVHAATAFVVAVYIDDALVRVSVTDGKPFASALERNFADDSTTGRGLRLVATLSSSWGVDTTDDTKTVWCEMVRAEELNDEAVQTLGTSSGELTGGALQGAVGPAKRDVWGQVA